MTELSFLPGAIEERAVSTVFRLIAGLAVLAVSILTVNASVAGSPRDKKPAKGKPPRIRVSKKTTYLLGPLRKDGFIDYGAAINARASKGVTPQNNAAVPLAEALGPSIFSPEKYRRKFFEKLGIPVPPEQGLYFLDMEQFSRRRRGTKQQRDAYRKDLYNQQEESMNGPWSRKRLPKLAAWLEYNRKPLEIVKSGLRREKWYHPMILMNDDATLISVLLPIIQQTRSMARALTARALLSVQERRLDDATGDLLASHRLARHAGSGQSLIEALVGYAVEAMACHADAKMLSSGRLSKKQLTDFRRELTRLPPLSPIAEKINNFERLAALDAVRLLANGGINALSELSSLEQPGESFVVTTQPSELDGLSIKIKVLNALLKQVDWNIVLTMVNTEFDRVNAAMAKPTFAERKKAIAAYGQHLGELVKNLPRLTDLVLGALNQKFLSEMVGGLFIRFMMPAITAGRVAEDRNVTRMQLTIVAVALERYRKANGRFPMALSALRPKFLSQIPKDLYSEKPLVFKPSRNGYLLYAVGRNREDDGGATFDSKPPGDDIPVRIKLAK